MGCNQTKEMKPWEEFWDMDIIGICTGAKEDTTFYSILGHGGDCYRTISLKAMGLDCNLIKLRSLHNRKFNSVLKELLEIKIQCNDIRFTEFDGAMRYFSDSK